MMKLQTYKTIFTLSNLRVKVLMIIVLVSYCIFNDGLLIFVIRGL